jgi:hypothetical protein
MAGSALLYSKLDKAAADCQAALPGSRSILPIIFISVTLKQTCAVKKCSFSSEPRVYCSRGTAGRRGQAPEHQSQRTVRVFGNNRLNINMHTINVVVSALRRAGAAGADRGRFVQMFSALQAVLAFWVSGRQQATRRRLRASSPSLYYDNVLLTVRVERWYMYGMTVDRIYCRNDSDGILKMVADLLK